MLVEAIKTAKITTDSGSIFEILNTYLPQLKEGSIVVVTSKIVAICEGSVAPMSENKEALVIEKSQRYIPAHLSKYNMTLSITNNMLIPNAGIDESNSDGEYVLWPKDPFESARAIQEHIRTKHSLSALGVIITDSTVAPLIWGISGRSIGHAGFAQLNNYIGEPDIFARTLEVSRSAIDQGLAAAAVVVMGEGAEQTPLAIISDVPFVNFSHSAKVEPAITIEDDLFGPLLTSVEWHKGGAK